MMKLPEIEDLRPEDLPNEDMQMLAEACGVETALKVMEACAGTSIYVPQWNATGYLRNRPELLRRLSTKELVRKFNISARQVCFLRSELKNKG